MKKTDKSKISGNAMRNFVDLDFLTSPAIMHPYGSHTTTVPIKKASIMQHSHLIDWDLFQDFPHESKLPFLRNRVKETYPIDDDEVKEWLETNTAGLYTIDPDRESIYFELDQDMTLMLLHFSS